MLELRKRFFRRTRQLFEGILEVFQEKLTQYGGKIAANTAFSNSPEQVPKKKL